MIPREITTLPEKYNETRFQRDKKDKKERKCVYTHEFIYHSRSHRISYRLNRYRF